MPYILIMYVNVIIQLFIRLMSKQNWTISVIYLHLCILLVYSIIYHYVVVFVLMLWVTHSHADSSNMYDTTGIFCILPRV